MTFRAAKASACLIAIAALTACDAAKTSFLTAADAIDTGVQSILADDDFIDVADVCVVERQALLDASHAVDDALVRRPLVGAAIDGIRSALKRDENAASDVAGVGPAASYLAELQDGPWSAAEVVASVNDDLAAENARIDLVYQSIDAVFACRADEGGRIQTAFADGWVTRSEAETQLAAVRRRHDQDVAKARQVVERIARNSDAFTAVYNEIAADNGAPGLEVSAAESRRARIVEVRVAPTPPQRLTRLDQVASLAISPDEWSGLAELRGNAATNLGKRNSAIAKVEAAASEEDAWRLPI